MKIHINSYVKSLSENSFIKNFIYTARLLPLTGYFLQTRSKYILYSLVQLLLNKVCKKYPVKGSASYCEKMKGNFLTILKAAIIAIVSGALLPCAFAPFGIYALAILAMVGLLIAFNSASQPRHALLYGWLFGAAFFGIGASWIYISIHYYGFMATPLALLVTALFVAVLALFPALQGYLLTKFFPQNGLKKSLLAFPATYLLFEWIRSYIFTGFPWLLLGYSQINSPLRSIAPLFGVYGTSFAVVFIAGCLVGIWQMHKEKRPHARLLLILVVVLLWGISAKLTYVDWTKPLASANATIKVALVQGDVPQEMKWQNEERDNILQKYRFLTQKHWNNDLIVWPEAALPTFTRYIPDFMEKIDKEAKRHNSTLIIGAALLHGSDKVGTPPLFYNGAVSLGINHGEYSKRHLVPFGEYMPFKRWLSWLDRYVQIPMSDFSAGDKKQPTLIAGKNILIAPFICYEIAYPNLVLDYLPQAHLLLTISDDSWFDGSLAVAQHLEIARMRSLESGREQVVCNNRGITAIIDSHGKVVASAPQNEVYVLTGEVTARDGSTPWVKYGHYLWWFFVVIPLVGALFSHCKTCRFPQIH